MAARDCARCGASVPIENMLTHELMCSRRLGKNVRASTAAAAPAATSPPEDEKSATKKLRRWAPPANAEVIDLLSDDDADVDSDGGLLSLEQQQKQKQIAADEALARSLADARDEAVQTAWAPRVRADSGASTSSAVLVTGARAPWRETAVWYEMQHRSECKICSSGYTFFTCTTDKNERELSHNMVPRPLPGQTLTVHYKPHALDGTRTRRHGAEVMRDDDGKVRRIVALTSGYVRFDMPPFAGQIETISIPGSAEKAYILRNFDGARGAELARRLEACYGLDILDPPSGRGSMSKCAAAQGHNCQDDYTKLYPLGMFADDNRFELLQPLLAACIGAVGGLELDRGGGIVTGEAQILRFRTAKTARGRGNRMHVHVDKKGTRWVALMSIGDSADFVIDNAALCSRCHHAGVSRWDRFKWYERECRTCKHVDLASGDCLLFFGDPEAQVAHGSLGTRANTAPTDAGLPAWARGGRVSCQYRLSAGFLDRRGILY